MKLLSTESFNNIRYTIQGEDYANIYARLSQRLSKKDKDIFANIQVVGNSAQWYIADDIDYMRYSDADDLTKDDIADCIEDCRTRIVAQIIKDMPFAASLFQIPSLDNIFWKRCSDGNISVLLTQWGFVGRMQSHDANLIEILLHQSRQTQYIDIKLHVDFSDGLPAGNTEFDLLIFNNRVTCKTDNDGNYNVGKLKCGKGFAVEDINHNQHQDFLIEENCTTYYARLDIYTCFTIIVLDSEGNILPNREFCVDEANVQTNEFGEFHCDKILLNGPQNINVLLNNEHYNFSLSRNMADNVFKIILNEEKQVEKYVKFKLFDYDGTPLSNMSFKVKTHDGKLIEGVCDENGACRMNSSDFVHGKKQCIVFNVTKEYRDNLKKQQDNSHENK